RLDARVAGGARGAEGHGAPGHAELARVERVHAADRLDQRRLARAVVAQQRDDLALLDGQRRAVERADRPVALDRSYDFEQRRHALAARRSRCSSRPRTTSSSSETITSTPTAISCQNGLTPSRSSPLRITPMISAPASTLT